MQHRRSRAVRIPLVAVLLVALLPTVLLPAAALAQSQGSPGLTADLADTRSARDQAEERLADARGAEQDARGRLAAVEEELEQAEQELTELQAAASAAQAAQAVARERERHARVGLATVVAELAATERHLEERRSQLDARVVAAFKHGQLGYAEALLVVGDLADLVATGTYLARVLESDRALVVEVEQLLADAVAKRARAHELRQDAQQQAAIVAATVTQIETARQAQQQTLARIEQRRAEREEVFVALRDDRAAIEAHLDGLAAESRRIEAQLAEIARQQAAEAERARLEAERRAAEAAQAAAQGGAQDGHEGDQDEPADAGGPGAPGGAGWVRPTSGPMTSGFGPRWGRNHNGVDLGVPVGTSVVAARAGVVVHVTAGCHPTSSPGCGGGFGNYVIVAHDDGVATVSAHLSSVAVGSGQVVAAGQAVGASGNSGNSTGPHLHFEIRVAGQAVNPCGYIAC